MSDNDNEKMVSLDNLRDERFAVMTPSEQLESRRNEADHEARLMTAAWVRHMRRRAGIERAELAKRLSIPDRSLELLELGKSTDTPTVAQVMLIADLCGLHFLGDIKTEAEMTTKVILSPEFVEQYRDLIDEPKE